MHIGRERSLNDWIDLVVDEFHRPLPREVEALNVLIEWIVSLGQDEGLGGALDACRELGRETLEHAEKEDVLLFPILRSGKGRLSVGRLQVMTIEHHDTYALMARIGGVAEQARTSRFPAVRSWAEAYLVFETRLREHMRIEDEELFPRAVRDGKATQPPQGCAVTG